MLEMAASWAPDATTCGTFLIKKVIKKNLKKEAGKAYYQFNGESKPASQPIPTNPRVADMQNLGCAKSNKGQEVSWGKYLAMEGTKEVMKAAGSAIGGLPGKLILGKVIGIPVLLKVTAEKEYTAQTAAIDAAAVAAGVGIGLLASFVAAPIGVPFVSGLIVPHFAGGYVSTMVKDRLSKALKKPDPEFPLVPQSYYQQWVAETNDYPKLQAMRDKFAMRAAQIKELDTILNEMNVKINNFIDNKKTEVINLDITLRSGEALTSQIALNPSDTPEKQMESLTLAMLVLADLKTELNSIHRRAKSKKLIRTYGSGGDNQVEDQERKNKCVQVFRQNISQKTQKSNKTCKELAFKIEEKYKTLESQFLANPPLSPKTAATISTNQETAKKTKRERPITPLKSTVASSSESTEEVTPPASPKHKKPRDK